MTTGDSSLYNLTKESETLFSGERARQQISIKSGEVRCANDLDPSKKFPSKRLSSVGETTKEALATLRAPPRNAAKLFGEGRDKNRRKSPLPRFGLKKILLSRAQLFSKFNRSDGDSNSSSKSKADTSSLTESSSCGGESSQLLKVLMFEQVYEKITRAQKCERDHESMVNQFKLRSTNAGLKGDSSWINLALSDPRSVGLMAPSRGRRLSPQGWSHAARVALLLTTLGQEKNILAQENGIVAREKLREDEILDFLKRFTPQLVMRITNYHQVAAELAEVRGLLENENHRVRVSTSPNLPLFPFNDRQSLIDQICGLQRGEIDGWRTCVKKRVACNLKDEDHGDDVIEKKMMQGVNGAREPYIPTIHPQSYPAMAWEIVILLFVLEQFVMIPFGISFELTKSEELVDFAAEVLFLMDIVFRLNLGYFEESTPEDKESKGRTDHVAAKIGTQEHDGSVPNEKPADSTLNKKRKMLVIDRLKIARNYTSKPVFMVDAMSAFPIFVSALEFHQGRSRYQWIRILKFFRLLKLGKMIKVVRQISKLMLELILSSSRRGWIDIWQYSRFLALLKLGGLFAMIGLAMHSLACIWHLVAPKSHWEHRLLDDGGNNYEQMSRKKVYLLSYYESILILMGEQIAMEHKYEYMFTILATILFSFLLAIIFGEVAIFIATINEVPLAYGRKMARLRDFMSSGANSLPKALQDRIFTFYDYLWTKHRTLDGAMKIASFLPELTPHLATEVRLFWCKDMLRTVPFFGILPPLVVQRLVAAVEMHFYMPDDYIIVAGEIGNEMFYLKSGKLDVCRVEKTEIEITDDLTDGSARRASRRHQRISFQRPTLQHHTRAPREFVKQERTASKGLPSARMGTYGRDSFDLRKPQPPRRPRASSRIQREQIVETLSQGSYFGEIALVAKCPRTVTVLVRTYAECAVVHRKDFEKMLADHPENFEQIMDMIRSKHCLAGSMKQTKCAATFDTVQEGPVVKAASVPPDAFSRSLSATSQATTCDQVKKGTVSQRVDSLEATICNLEDILLHQVHDAPRVSLQTVLDPRHSPTNSMPTQPKSQSNIR